MAVIGSLSVKLGLVTVEWDKATAQAKKQAKDLQAAFKDLGVDMSRLQNLFRTLGGAAGLSVAGFAAMSRAVMDMAGKMKDLADATGVSEGRILQFQKALVMAGGKAEDANTILNTLFTKIASAQGGNDAAIAQFERLGISFQELRNMTPDQAIKRVYDGLRNIGNSFERVKAVREMLGKAGLGKSIEEVADALGKSRGEFDRQAASLKKWDDMADSLTESFFNLKLAFAELLAPFTSSTIISVNQFKSLMVAITSAIVVNGMFKLVAAFRALNAALKTTAALSVAMSAAGGLKGIATGAAAVAAYLGAMVAFKDDEASAEAPEQQPMGEGDGGATGGKQAAQLRARLDLMKQMLDIDKRRGEYQLNALTTSQDEARLGESRLKYEEDILRARSEYAQALEKEDLSQEQLALSREEYNLKIKKAQQDYQIRDELINAQRTQAIQLYEQETKFIQQRNALTENSLRLEQERRYLTEFEYERAKEQLDLEQKLLQIEQDRQRLKLSNTQEFSPEYVNEMNRLKNAEQAARTEAQLRLDRIALNEKEAMTWSGGWEKAMREFNQNAERYGDTGASAFNMVVNSMSSALDNFVRTGKISFKNLILSMIQDLLVLQMRMLAMTLVRNLFSSFGWGASTTSLGGTNGMALNTIGSSGFATAADGGYINSPTIVGEHGPELFIPNRQGGTVVPTQQMAGMGSAPQVVYNGPYIASMNAIDTQTATQFLARNKEAVWAANQSAQRSIPQSR